MGNILKDARKGKGLTQAALAASVGCDQATISKYENGSASPTTEIAPKLAGLLGLSVVQVLYPLDPGIWGDDDTTQKAA